MNKRQTLLAASLLLSACGSDTSESENKNVNSPALFTGVSSAEINNQTQTTSNSVIVNDSDEGEAKISSLNNLSTSYGTFSISETGAWTYELNVNHTDIVKLPLGSTLTDTITIASFDGTTSNVTITIQGTFVANTAAAFTGDTTASLSIEESAAKTGVITVTDADEGESSIVEQYDEVLTYGAFSIASNGAWGYQLDVTNSDVLALSSSTEFLTESITVTSVDGSSVNLVITIFGADNELSEAMGFNANEGGNHLIGYTDSVPEVTCTNTVNSISALESAAESLAPGDTLCLADGNYNGDFELRIEGQGTAENPITVAAENPGKAIISGGKISARLGGKHIVLQSFVFRDGESGSSIIKFEASSECQFCRVTEVSIIDMDGGDYNSSKWVEYYGQYNRIDHSWFSGKVSRGALLVLPRWIDENTFASSGFPADYAQIDYNYFGERPPAWGRAYAASGDNEYEAVRLGLSTTHSAPSYSVLEHNYFERIQGEAEVISNKSASNTIRNNTIRDSYGSIVNRHGANATIANNFVLGDDHPFSGGIRLVDDGHTVVNNYVSGARYLSSNWNGGIVLTAGNGAGDTENGYQNVSNVLLAYNTIVDSVNSLNVFGGKYNVAPTGVYFVNNLIANAIGPVLRTNGESMPTDSTFTGNYIQGQYFADDTSVLADDYPGLLMTDLKLERGSDDLYRPSTETPDISATPINDMDGFTLPNTDIDGQKRSAISVSGADETIADASNLTPLSPVDVGPKHYRPTAGKTYVESTVIHNHDFDSGDLTHWSNDGGTGAAIVSNEHAFSRGYSLQLNSNAAAVSQSVMLKPNTHYTLSAFMKGAAKLTVTVNGEAFSAQRKSDSYGFSSVSFFSGDATVAVLTAAVDDLITNKANLLNANFNDGQEHWTVVEGTGIGQVQDSSNSASGADGSIKFKWNSGDDTGTPHSPYIAQTVAVEPNTDYKLSIYNLYKKSNSDSSIIFGVSTASDITDVDSWIAAKDSSYTELKQINADKGDDSFLQDYFGFNSGNSSSLTVFAQFKSSTGEEIRVDDFELSYQGAPAEGTTAYFDSIRLVSHPLSESESQAAENN